MDFALTSDILISIPPDRPIDVDLGPYEDENATGKLVYHIPDEEISLAPACWLWDYLRFDALFIIKYLFIIYLFIYYRLFVKGVLAKVDFSYP